MRIVARKRGRTTKVRGFFSKRLRTRFSFLGTDRLIETAAIVACRAV